jgi:hypothetical protein
VALAGTVSELPREARAVVTASINAQYAKNAPTRTELASCMSAFFNF